jgi:Ca2+-transporting ATPase
VFSGFLRNYIFIAILVMTVAAQIVIVYFGGIVFNLEKGGLSIINWLICIAIGSGSLIVGFLIRTLPEFEVPIWLLGGRPNCALDVQEKEKVIHENLAKISSVQRWGNAIKKTRLQVRVVKIFTLPKDSTEPIPRSSSREISTFAVTEQISQWKKLRLYVRTSIMFKRGRKDISTVQLADPRSIRMAQINYAKSKQQL